MQMTAKMLKKLCRNGLEGKLWMNLFDPINPELRLHNTMTKTKLKYLAAGRICKVNNQASGSHGSQTKTHAFQTEDSCLIKHQTAEFNLTCNLQA